MPIQIQSVMCGMICENAWIVGVDGRDDCVVVDPGDEYPKLLRALAGRRVGAILLTHGHFDHIRAAGPMAEAFDAPVYVGAEDVEMLNDPGLNGLETLLGKTSMPGPALNAVPFGERLSACGLEFQVLPTPGHSRGSVCLYLPEEKALFSGDTLFEEGYGRTDLYGGDIRALGNSLRALFALPEDVRVYPGHGDETTIGVERARDRL